MKENMESLTHLANEGKIVNKTLEQLKTDYAIDQLMHGRTEVYPEDVQELAPYVLSHRIWLGPHAASHGLTTDLVIKDIVERVPIP